MDFSEMLHESLTAIYPLRYVPVSTGHGKNLSNEDFILLTHMPQQRTDWDLQRIEQTLKYSDMAGAFLTAFF